MGTVELTGLLMMATHASGATLAMPSARPCTMPASRANRDSSIGRPPTRMRKSQPAVLVSARVQALHNAYALLQDSHLDDELLSQSRWSVTHFPFSQTDSAA